MRTSASNNCLLCGCVGLALYTNQQDKLFGAAGNWNIVKCTNVECQLLWLNPMPIIADIGQAYTNYYTHDAPENTIEGSISKVKHYIKNCYLSSKYGYTAVVNGSPLLLKIVGLVMYLFPSKRAEADFSIMHLPLVERGRLLEVGCGSGAMLLTMKNLGWLVEGVEVDPAGVLVARAKGLIVHEGDLYSKKYSDCSFDAVTLSHVIEHVHDPLGLIHECSRILKPGGKLVIVTPNSESLGHVIYKSSWLHLDPPRHLHIFNYRTLEQLSKKVGLVTEISKTIIRDANTLFIASQAIRKAGHYVWGSDIAASYLLKTSAKLLQLYEHFYLKIRPFKGEELLLVATKGVSSDK